MKKALLIILSLSLWAIVAFGQPAQDNRLTVAMDVRGVVPIGTSAAGAALSGELATAIGRSGKYVVVNRSPEALKAIAQEINYTQTGAVKEAKAMREKIGKQDTVSFLCVVDVKGDSKGGYYVRAVLTHVATGREGEAATAASRFEDIFEVMAVAKRLAKDLTGVDLGTWTAPPVQPVQPPVQEVKPAPQVQQAAPVQPPQPPPVQEVKPTPPPIQEARPVQPSPPPPVQEVKPALPPPPMNPKDAAKAAFERGETARYKQYAWNAAIGHYTEAIRLDPDGDGYYIERAHTYMIINDYNKAITDLTEASRIKSKKGWKIPAQVFSSRGDCYMKVGNYAQAIADYEEWLRLQPQNKWAKERLKEAKRLMK